MQKNIPLSISIQREIEKHRLNMESEIDKSMHQLGFRTLLNQSGIRKEKGYAPISLLFVLMLLPFLKQGVRALWVNQYCSRFLNAQKDTILMELVSYHHDHKTNRSQLGCQMLQLGASVSEGAAQITASGQAVMRFLPPGTNPPIIIRYNSSTVLILQYSLANKKFSEQEPQDSAFNQVRAGLMNVRWASLPYPYGGTRPETECT